jgi:asparagine synthase (glutamine-hydrolysing)
MCGIAGALHLSLGPIDGIRERLVVMNDLQKHRGPDGEGIWVHPRRHVGFAHRRLSIIDLVTGEQPMDDEGQNWLTYNGEIYNFIELREELGVDRFKTRSDTEVILHAYRKWGAHCLDHFRGMFAFALWDETGEALFCARDRFGIKPLYYTVVGGTFYFSSEVKALLPFVDAIETDVEAFKDYLAFQLCLDGKTLFRGIREIPPGHFLEIRNGQMRVERFWQVYYHLDLDKTAADFEQDIRSLLAESVRLHMRSDVPVGAYISGGLDSSIVAALAAGAAPGNYMGFTGKFSLSEEYDESRYAREIAGACGFHLHELDISAADFIENISNVIYHLDYPVAGPGSFPQFMVSRLAAEYRKVVLGGQGGDEIFGGYARYLIAYFEQCIKGAIDGTMHNAPYIVTYASIIPNLSALRNYKPLLREFWREGLFEDMDKRYFRLINRGSMYHDEIRMESLNDYSPYETFRHIFTADNVRQESYFDSMTHFDFKTLLPALLHVEDRVSMAHGLESRVPFLDHPLVELAATIPASIKFSGGRMKHVLKAAMQPLLPPSIVGRQDKMGFPVPLTEWINGEMRDFITDIFSSRKAMERDLINNGAVLKGIETEPKFGRKIWGLLCLELWQREFHDRARHFKNLLKH